jgi:hypothetical protein
MDQPLAVSTHEFEVALFIIVEDFSKYQLPDSVCRSKTSSLREKHRKTDPEEGNPVKTESQILDFVGYIVIVVIVSEKQLGWLRRIFLCGAVRIQL